MRIGVVATLAAVVAFSAVVGLVAAQEAASAPARFPVKVGTKGWGYVGVDGKSLVAPAWQRAMPFSEGRAAIKRDNQWGYIDETGTEVVAPQFASAGEFHAGRALVEKRAGQLAGWIDASGKLVLDAAALDVVRGDDFSDGLALAVARSRLSGYVDPNGKSIVPAKLMNATRFSGGRALVTQQDGKTGFIDTTGKMVIEVSAQATTGAFHEDLCYVHQADGKHVYLRTDGQVAFEPTIAAADKPAFGDFAEGHAAFRARDKWGFIDTSGAVVVPAKYSAVLAYSEGLAAVFDAKNKAGFIDAKGKLVIKHQFTEAMSFRNGLARVENGKKGWFYVNAKGKVVAKIDDAAKEKAAGAGEAPDLVR